MNRNILSYHRYFEISKFSKWLWHRNWNGRFRNFNFRV